MRILIYKRTHRGDPDARGVFGIDDCMGKVRDFRYDAVIGVGGLGDDPHYHGIAGTINWVGVGPRRVRTSQGRGSLVTFDHFLFHDTAGPDFRVAAPNLAAHVYDKKVRLLLDDLTSTERAEALAIVKAACSHPASPGRYRLGHGVRAPYAGQRRPFTARCGGHTPPTRPLPALRGVRPPNQGSRRVDSACR